jgi:hypothetical protein
MSAVVTVETYANAKVMGKVVAYVRQDRHSRERVERSSHSFPIGACLWSLKTTQDTNYDFESYSLYNISFICRRRIPSRNDSLIHLNNFLSNPLAEAS